MTAWMGWTLTAEAVLRKAVADGKSGGETARLIGCTRNAAIGKANRLGLTFGLTRPSDPKSSRFKPKPPAPVKTYGFGAGIKFGLGQNLAAVNAVRKVERLARDAARALPVPSLTVAAGSNPKPWLQRLSGECAWPVSGVGADTLSCCAPGRHATAGGFYCAAHWKVRNQKASGYLSDRSMDKAHGLAMKRDAA